MIRTNKPIIIFVLFTALAITCSAARAQGIYNISFQDIKKQKEELSKHNEIDSGMLNTRMDRYNKIKEKVEVYETVLNGTAEELKDELKDLTTALHKKLTE